jgi:hypothetical protein
MSALPEKQAIAEEIKPLSAYPTACSYIHIDTAIYKHHISFA